MTFLFPEHPFADIDLDYFRWFFKIRFEQELEGQDLSLGNLLSNMRLLRNDLLTVTGVLLFTKDPRAFLPVFHVKLVCYPGNDIHATTYMDSADISGRIQTQFEESLSFVLRNLRRQQNGKGVNTTGEVEIPKIVLEELLTNALIHRDYFVSAPIRIFMFDERVEIISPGHLPNNLTVANIRSGNSSIRNKEQSEKMPVLVYPGTDSATSEHASEDRPIIMLTRRSPRRDCEINYLRRYCKIEELSDDPKVLKEKSNLETNAAEKALAFRIGSILSNDYFLDSHIKFGSISHGLPVLVTKRKVPVEIFLDPAGATVRVILELYESQFSGIRTHGEGLCAQYDLPPCFRTRANCDTSRCRSLSQIDSPLSGGI